MLPKRTLETYRKRFRIKDKLKRNLMAEFMGTFLLLFIGGGVNAQHILSDKKMNTWMSINLGWGVCIMLVAQSMNKLSGSHFNPAISLLLYSFGEISLLELILYSIFQTVGAFFGSAAAYLVYFDAINKVEGGDEIRTVGQHTSTAGMFATYPQDYLTVRGAILDQITGTAILAFFIAVISDKRNNIPVVARPIFAGATVLLIGLSFGMNCGYAINPARDLGPRIFTVFIYGWKVFTYPNSTWFLVPIVCPLIGSLLGGWFYHFVSGFHIPDDGVDISVSPSLADMEFKYTETDVDYECNKTALRQNID